MSTERPRWRWPRPRARTAAPAVPTRELPALLALVPDPDQSRAVRDAVHEVGVPYGVPVRITLHTGLDPRDHERWQAAVRGVARRHPPFTVRLVGPEVVANRTLVLRVLGEATTRLRDDLRRSLQAYVTADEYAEDDGGPVLPLAGTWTAMDRVELHDAATGIRNELSIPLDFRATALYAFEEGGDGLPFLEFPLGAA